MTMYARMLGVDSLPIALFIALFTGIVLALSRLLDHGRRAALFRRYAGREDGDHGTGAVLTTRARRPRRRKHRGRTGDDASDRADRRARTLSYDPRTSSFLA